MPTNKNAQLRLQVLDRCFSDRSRYYFIDNLINSVNETLDNNGMLPVSRRTIFNDISFMQSNPDWDVEFEEPAIIDGRRYYRYADTGYSIWKNDLNEQQIEQLKSMMLLLQQFRGLPQFERIQEVLKQLEEKYKFSLQSQKTVIAFDTNDEAAGVEHLSTLFDAIVSRQTLRITYQPYGKETFKSIVHPYFIKQFNNRWFLLGATTKDKQMIITNMPFDRIQHIEYAAIPFVDNTFCDFDEFFDDIIGVTKTDAKVQNIVLRVAPKRLPYILSKPLHPSQRNHRSNEGIIELKVIPNRELYQLLLAYGPDIEVIEPTDIREQMKQYAELMVECYK